MSVQDKRTAQNDEKGAKEGTQKWQVARKPAVKRMVRHEDEKGL